jgi:subfamily B ATP-binding cassette protein MsbA
VNLIQGAVSMTIAGILKDAFTIFSLIGVAFYQNWKLAIIAFFIFPLGIIPIRELGKRVRKFARKGHSGMASSTLLHEPRTGL